MMKYKTDDIYFVDIYDGDKLVKHNESVIYSDDRDMFITVNDHLIHMVEPAFSDNITKEKYEEEMRLVETLFMPYKRVEKGLYIDEASIKEHLNEDEYKGKKRGR